MRRPITDAQRQRIRIIIDEVCRQFKMMERKVLGNSRAQRHFLPRVAMATALREFVQLSSPKIGEIMNRDHSTILYMLSVGERYGWLRGTLKRIESQIHVAERAYEIAQATAVRTNGHGIELYGDNGVAW